MYEASEYLEIISVKILDNHRLSIKFSDGIMKEVNLAQLIKNPPPVFVELKNEEEFKTACINPVGGISWSCGADLSAEYLRSV